MATKSNYRRSENICNICSNNIAEYYYSEVCKKCNVKDYIFPVYKTYLPSQIIEIISYYLDTNDLIEINKSGICSNIIKTNYYVNRLMFWFPNLKVFMLREIFNNNSTFIQKLNYLISIKNYGVNEMIKYIINTYKNLVYNDQIIDKDKKIKVLYHIEGKTHLGYCSGAETDEEFDNNIEEEYNVSKDLSIQDLYIFDKGYVECDRGSGYCHMGIQYDILKIVELKNNI